MIGVRRTVFLAIVVLGTAVAAAACSADEQAGNLDLFGLRAACMPTSNTSELVVAPGEIILQSGQSFDELDFDVEADGGMEYRLGVATSGVLAGDLIRRDPSMSFMLDDDVALEGPGTWPIAVVFTPDGDTESLDISRVHYQLDGERYVEDVLFELTIEETC